MEDLTDHVDKAVEEFEQYVQITRTPAGDPDYLKVLEEMKTLHLNKSSSYGTKGDPFDNFTRNANRFHLPTFAPPFMRAYEKMTRAINLYEQGDYAPLDEEFIDIASCMVIALVLRRRGGLEIPQFE